MRLLAEHYQMVTLEKVSAETPTIHVDPFLIGNTKILDWTEDTCSHRSKMNDVLLQWYTPCGAKGPIQSGSECDVEAAMFETFGQIKALNPNVTTILCKSKPIVLSNLPLLAWLYRSVSDRALVIACVSRPEYHVQLRHVQSRWGDGCARGCRDQGATARPARRAGAAVQRRQCVPALANIRQP